MSLDGCTLSDWIDITQVAAQAALIATGIVAVMTIMRQRISDRASSTARLLPQLREQWDSPPMHRDRSRLAAELLDHPGQPPNIPATRRVLDFFQTLGLYVNLDVVLESAVYSTFSEQAEIYWRECQDAILAARQVDPTYYEDYCGLVRRLERLDRRKSASELSPRRIREFLEYERLLTTPDALTDQSRQEGD